MILLDVDNLNGLIDIWYAIMIIPPILLILICFAIKKWYPTAAYYIFILAGIYLTIDLSIWGALLL